MKPAKRHYVLVVNRAEKLDGGWIPAAEMARRRINAGQWGLYANTPHRREIATGDQVIVYLAGTDVDAKTFVARAEVARVNNIVRVYSADEDALAMPPAAVLEITDAEWFANPVQIAAVKDQLQFVPKNTPRWGCVLQRGAKRICEEDASTILRCASA